MQEKLFFFFKAPFKKEEIKSNASTVKLQRNKTTHFSLTLREVGRVSPVLFFFFGTSDPLEVPLSRLHWFTE